MGVLSAASTWTATAYYNIPRHSFRSSRKERISLGRTNASDTSSSVETSSWSEADVIESPQGDEGKPSVISTLNVERALRGVPITDIDYYGELGLQRGCSNDQVYAAYKNKIEEWMSKGLDEEELKPNLEILKESFGILSDPVEKRLYDWSLARGAKPDRYAWPFEVDTLRKTPDDPPPQEPEDFGPTRAVGYFMLGWLLLGFATSIALNR